MIGIAQTKDPKDMRLVFFVSLSTHIIFRAEDCKYTNQWPRGAIVTCSEQRSKGYGSSIFHALINTYNVALLILIVQDDRQFGLLL
jgi:hypothetical protein